MATDSELLGRITALEREFSRLQGSVRTVEARPSGAGRAPDNATYLTTVAESELASSSVLDLEATSGLTANTVGGITTISLDPGGVTATGTGPLPENVGGTGERTYTKGDLLAGDGTGLTKRSVGVNGLALLADSTHATGLSYGAPTPASHTHAESDVTNLTTDLAALTTSIALNRVTALQFSPVFATANLTTTRNWTSARSFALYMGKAPKAITSMVVNYRITTAFVAGSSGSWAEVGIATGAPVNVGNPSLTLNAYTDVSATINSTGVKSTTVSGLTLAAGDDVWVIHGNDPGSGGSPAAAVGRAQSIADDLGTGFSALKATTRPSTMGAAASFTNDGTTSTPFWISVSW